MFQNGGQNHKWPTNGWIGCITAMVRRVPKTSQRGRKSEVAHKWASWLPNPCHPAKPQSFRVGEQNQHWPTNGWIDYVTAAVKGGPQHLRAGNKIRSGPQVGGLAT